jgi:hypothetical protein
VREDLRSDILERAHQIGDLRTDFVESDTTDGGSEDGPHPPSAGGSAELHSSITHLAEE